MKISENKYKIGKKMQVNCYVSIHEEKVLRLFSSFFLKLKQFTVK